MELEDNGGDGEGDNTDDGNGNGDGRDGNGDDGDDNDNSDDDGILAKEEGSPIGPSHASTSGLIVADDVSAAAVTQATRAPGSPWRQ